MIQGILTKAQFLEIVMNEINLLRTKATQEEKDKLNFDNLKFSHPTLCIYGQMTGYYDSKRAIELSPKIMGDYLTRSKINQYNETGELTVQSGNVSTPLENYLFLSADLSHINMNSNLTYAIGIESDKHREIIEYIKGERDTLTL